MEVKIGSEKYKPESISVHLQVASHGFALLAQLTERSDHAITAHIICGCTESIQIKAVNLCPDWILGLAMLIRVICAATIAKSQVQLAVKGVDLERVDTLVIKGRLLPRHQSAHEESHLDDSEIAAGSAISANGAITARSAISANGAVAACSAVATDGAVAACSAIAASSTIGSTGAVVGATLDESCEPREATRSARAVIAAVGVGAVVVDGRAFDRVVIARSAIPQSQRAEVVAGHVDAIFGESGNVAEASEVASAAAGEGLTRIR